MIATTCVMAELSVSRPMSWSAALGGEDHLDGRDELGLGRGVGVAGLGDGGRRVSETLGGVGDPLEGGLHDLVGLLLGDVVRLGGLQRVGDHESLQGDELVRLRGRDLPDVPVRGALVHGAIAAEVADDDPHRSVGGHGDLGEGLCPAGGLVVSEAASARLVRHRAVDRQHPWRHQVQPRGLERHAFDGAREAIDPFEWPHRDRDGERRRARWELGVERRAVGPGDVEDERAVGADDAGGFAGRRARRASPERGRRRVVPRARSPPMPSRRAPTMASSRRPRPMAGTSSRHTRRARAGSQW